MFHLADERKGSVIMEDLIIEDRLMMVSCEHYLNSILPDIVKMVAVWLFMFEYVLHLMRVLLTMS